MNWFLVLSREKLSAVQMSPQPDLLPDVFFFFDDENISFEAVLLYIYSTNVPPIMIINRIYEHQNLLSRSLFPSGRSKDLSSPSCIHRFTNPRIRN